MHFWESVLGSRITGSWVYYGVIAHSGDPQAKLFYCSLFISNGGSSSSWMMQGTVSSWWFWSCFYSKISFCLVLLYLASGRAVLQAPVSPPVPAQGRLSSSPELHGPVDVEVSLVKLLSLLLVSTSFAANKPPPNHYNSYLPMGNSLFLTWVSEWYKAFLYSSYSREKYPGVNFWVTNRYLYLWILFFPP